MWYIELSQIRLWIVDICFTTNALRDLYVLHKCSFPCSTSNSLMVFCHISHLSQLHIKKRKETCTQPSPSTLVIEGSQVRRRFFISGLCHPYPSMHQDSRYKFTLSRSLVYHKVNTDKKTLTFTFTHADSSNFFHPPDLNFLKNGRAAQSRENRDVESILLIVKQRRAPLSHRAVLQSLHTAEQ